MAVQDVMKREREGEFNEYLWRLGLKDPFSSSDLEEQVRVRISGELRRELDRIRAYVTSAGYSVSRSDLVRVALVAFIEGFQEEIPGVSEVVLPEERTDDQQMPRPAHKA